MLITCQFSIRHLLFATILTAIFVTCLQAIPGLFLYAFALAVALGAAGAAGICVTLLFALAISISEDDGNRRFNLARCRDLIGVGLIANLPLAICFLVVPYI